jgi:hypothetical protein
MHNPETIPSLRRVVPRTPAEHVVMRRLSWSGPTAVKDGCPVKPCRTACSRADVGSPLAEPAQNIHLGQ